MTLPLVFDDGVRFTETIRIRVPPTLRVSLKAAAEAEGVLPTEFARRAIAERITRTTAPGGSPAPSTTETAET